MKRMIRLVAGSALFVFVLVATCNGADSSEFTVGSATGIPGGEVKVPIYLTLSAGQQIERVMAAIDYPRVLAYEKAVIDKEAGANGVSMTGKESESQTGDKMKRIAITITAPKGKSLPALVMGSLVFVVDKKAPQQRLSVPVSEIKGFLKGSETEVKVRGNPGNVAIYESAVQPQPLTGCFFFSH